MFHKFKIATINKISPVGLRRFTEKYEVSEDLESANALIVRSAKLHDTEFPETLLAIGRAGVGVNNIPIERCAEEGIVVFNTPGANANGVKELVIGGMLMGYRHLVAASNWATSLEDGELSIEKQVEKGKSQFKGNELMGKTLGVIGLGGIGGPVANIAISLGLNVYGYDAYLSEENAHKLSSRVHLVDNMLDMMPKVDFLTMHVHANAETNGMINKEVFDAIKPGAILLNYARASIVDNAALKEALESGKISQYITDFPCTEVKGLPNVIMTPHLGASTDEAEDNCAAMAVDQIMDYIEHGNIIINSVNFPRANLGKMKPGESRIAIMTKGVANPVDIAIKTFGATDIEISAIAGGVKGDFGYVLLSTFSDLESIPRIEGAIKVRVIHK